MPKTLKKIYLFILVTTLQWNPSNGKMENYAKHS